MVKSNILVKVSKSVLELNWILFDLEGKNHNFQTNLENFSHSAKIKQTLVIEFPTQELNTTLNNYANRLKLNMIEE